MRKINYPLIITDFDGTLTGSDGKIAPETRNAIDAYVSAGGRFCVCTGRMTSSILPRVKELGLSGLVASYQGAVISDIQSGKILVDGYISKEETSKICGVFELFDLHTHVYDLERFYVNREDEALKAYEKLCGVKGELVTNEPLSAFVSRTGLRARKILAMVGKEEKFHVYQRLSAILGDEFNVTYSAANLVEVTRKAYSKGSAVKFMADYYGIPIERTVAVGDNLNDLPMLETAGIGIAVANADPTLKDKAIALEYTNDENAIGTVIGRYGFTGEKI